MSDLKAETILNKHWRNFRNELGLEYEDMGDKAKAHLLTAMDEYAVQQANGVTTEEKQCNLPVIVCSNCPKVIGLTVGKSYTQLAKHKDIIALVNDYGDLKRYNIAYFK